MSTFSTKMSKNIELHYYEWPVESEGTPLKVDKAIIEPRDINKLVKYIKINQKRSCILYDISWYNIVYQFLHPRYHFKAIILCWWKDFFFDYGTLGHTFAEFTQIFPLNETIVLFFFLCLLIDLSNLCSPASWVYRTVSYSGSVWATQTNLDSINGPTATVWPTHIGTKVNQVSKGQLSKRIIVLDWSERQRWTWTV